MGTLAADVELVRTRPDAVAALSDVYARIASETDQRRPLCVVSGRCCRFEEWGHRLYVTTLELAAFAATGPITAPPQWSGQGCPFQSGKLCSVHTRRPMGCRLFFCDTTSTQWQQELYERFHADIKQLHTAFEIPYRYMEWRAALAELGSSACDPNG